MTVVDDVEIHPDLIAGYIQRMAQRYYIKSLALDNNRFALVSRSLKQIGFDATDHKNVHLVRPSDIMKTAPVIESVFVNRKFTWGDNPALRWAVNNTKLVRSSRNIGCDTGNFVYAKIEAKSRKTDPFMALVAAMTIEDVLQDVDYSSLPNMDVIIG